MKMGELDLGFLYSFANQQVAKQLYQTCRSFPIITHMAGKSDSHIWQL